MRRRVLLLATALGVLVIGFGFFDRDATAEARKPDLVLVGTVAWITQGGSLLKPWIVTIDVEKVLSGELAGSRFEFATHSPARLGLEKGRSYKVRAVWRGNGYEVRETERPEPISAGPSRRTR